MMPKLPNGLTPLEQAFIPAYIRSGLNATQAYQTIRPDVSETSAAVLATRMLKKVKVQEALQEQFNKQSDQSIASREYLTTEAHDIGQEARKRRQLGTALSAVELKGKLNRVFTQEEPEMEGYKVLMQSLIVNVQGKPAENVPGKDITPLPDVGEDEDSV